MDLQQPQAPVDLLHEPAVAHQPLDGADAAMRRRLHAIGQFVANARRIEDRTAAVELHGLGQPRLNSVLPCGESPSYLFVHSKCLVAGWL